MIISIIQPCFVPWLGYFEQIARADVFVYMDDVQYTKKDWRNRNRLKSPYGIKNIHVPVQKPSRDTLLMDVLISYNENWEDTFLNKLREWYKTTKYFDEIYNLIEAPVLKKYEKLVDFNYDLNHQILQHMGINTPIYFTSDIPRKSNGKNERIVEICKHHHANMLYDGKSAQNFIEMQLFRENGIEVIFQDYKHPSYTQLCGTFAPQLSIIDLLMNTGKEAQEIILSSPVSGKLLKQTA
ncbi:MAG: hypothetical protein COA57_01055 [Flavobacteriales bacterium]|nr:MAG: hypothetical protein COA57_01055 [Flavobacteriales bacterium]